MEKLRTLSEAAEVVGVPVWKLRRAATQGAFPTYALVTNRRLVKLSEVIDAINDSQKWGDR